MARPVLALVLWLAFAAVAFGWRTLLQLRRYGDSGWRIEPGGGAVAVLAHISFVLSLLLSLLAPIAALVAGEPHLPGGVEALAEPGSSLAAVAAVLGAIAMSLGAWSRWSPRCTWVRRGGSAWTTRSAPTS